MLIAGIVLGVVLGPAVLGRISPPAYTALFGGRAHAQNIATREEQMRRQLKSLVETGATVEAQTNHQEALNLLRKALKQKQDHRAAGLATALVLALIATMVIECLVSPQLRAAGSAVVSPAIGRLSTIRYALVALWITVVLARPTMLQQVPLLFAALVILVALSVGLVPLGPRKPQATP